MIAVVNSTEDKKDALPIIFGAVIVAGVLGFIAAPFFSKLVRFFPPVVTGTVITLIGVSLLPVAFGWAQGPNPAANDYGSTTYLALAGVTLVIVLLLRRFTRGFVKQIAVLLGLVIGTLVAIPFGVTDFSPIGRRGRRRLPDAVPLRRPAVRRRRDRLAVRRHGRLDDRVHRRHAGARRDRRASRRREDHRGRTARRHPRLGAQPACSTASCAAPSPRTSAWSR